MPFASSFANQKNGYTIDRISSTLITVEVDVKNYIKDIQICSYFPAMKQACREIELNYGKITNIQLINDYVSMSSVGRCMFVFIEEKK